MQISCQYLNVFFRSWMSCSRILQPSNPRYISELKDRWDSFYAKVQFYGVMKKAMKPPKTLNGGETTMHRFVQVYILRSYDERLFMLLPCFMPFISNQWSMLQLFSEPCHCSFHPALCHLESWEQAMRAVTFPCPNGKCILYIMLQSFMHA